MNKIDVMEEMKSVIMSDEVLLRTFNYYGIKNDGRSKCICCFHDDKSFGNAFFGKIPGRFRCFKCGESYDSIEIVSKMEPSLGTFYEKLCFIYKNILGIPVPSYEKEEKFLSGKQLEAIGMEHALGGYIRCHVGMINRMDNPPDGLEKTSADDDGMCVLIKKQRSPSLYELYKEDPQPILEMLQDKSVEKLNSLSREINNTFNRKTEIGRICYQFNDLGKMRREELKKQKEEVYEIFEIIKKMEKKKGCRTK